jgi:hypothetical protein
MEGSFNENEETNRIRIENEIKKMKISLENGGLFFSSPDHNLSPELESQFLDNIRKFEDAISNNKMVLIYDLIGKPKFRPVNEIQDDEITKELERLNKLLGKKHVEVGHIYEVEEREMYRFITEDLFVQEIDDMNIPGWTTHLTYEEFYPNHDGDIRDHSTDFVECLLNKEKDMEYSPIASEICYKEEKITKKEFIKKLEFFRQAFSSIELDGFFISLVQFQENDATVYFDINYSVTIEGTTETKKFSGKGKFGLIKEHDYWSVNQINIPGIN